MIDESFVEYVMDQLVEIPDIRMRKMFGAHGLYQGDVFFAIVSDGTLYFKTTLETAKRYVQKGMGPFVVSKDQVLKNYYEVPPDILEDREAIVEWAGEAIGVGSL